MIDNWQISESSLDLPRKHSLAAVYSLGNGYVCCRGFFEEDSDPISKLGGIYVAGVFDKTSSEVDGEIAELVNVPNFLSTKITVETQQVHLEENTVSSYNRFIDMKNGFMRRSYTWQSTDFGKVTFNFERFISMHSRHIVGQSIKLRALDDDCKVCIDAMIDGNISNLNLISTEPYPIQPGRVHFRVNRILRNSMEVETLDGSVKLAIGQQSEMKELETGIKIDEKLFCNDGQIVSRYSFLAQKDKTYSLTKIVYLVTSLDIQESLFDLVSNKLAVHYDYVKEFGLNSSKWNDKWESSDIKIDGDENDQLAIRYSLFHLLQACPPDERFSIGARGLTGEMYGGAVFWDTEIFMLPFYILTNPSAALQLLKWRYNTLPRAKQNASALWFKGAKYAWESGPYGDEQTPVDGGAFYAVHIVSDVAYAVSRYLSLTNDERFLLDYGLEILIETSRFWASRASYDVLLNAWSIIAVRGPNEYDNVVNNNFYTNMMAKENLYSTVRYLNMLKQDYPDEWEKLSIKLRFDENEISIWSEIAESLYIACDYNQKLYLEDDRYLSRAPFDLKKGKPTTKRVIDSTLPYESLAMYQVTKQADVITLMNLIPNKFTKEEKQIAWEFYEPKTAHDSSLSYSPHAIMAARLGYIEDALSYFRKAAFVDLDNLKLNSISGLHFANFGGTWQAIVFGFVGLDAKENELTFEPNVPDEWGHIEFTMHFRGWLLRVKVENKWMQIVPLTANDNSIKIVYKKDFAFLKKDDSEVVLQNS